MGNCFFTSKERIWIDKDNWDPMDTLAPLTLPKGFEEDTPANRADAALACCVQLTNRVKELEAKFYALEHVSPE